ncbi:atypical arm repeat domain-containing protein [Ditylenchus destructor]|nr:atypical arm repeat domain-containing protein [Ditylenchus destructor]
MKRRNGENINLRKFENSAETTTRLRDKRLSDNIVARKLKRDELLRQLRSMPEGTQEIHLDIEIPNISERSIFDEDLIANLSSDVIELRLDALRAYQHLMKSAVDSSVVEDVITLGIAPVFFSSIVDRLLPNSPHSDAVKSTSLSIIATLVSQCEQIDSDWFSPEVLSCLYNLSRTSSLNIVKNVLITLSYAIESSNDIRDQCFQIHAADEMISLFNRFPDISVRRIVLTAITSLYSWPTDETNISLDFLRLAKDILTGNDENMAIECLDCINNIAQMSTTHVNLLISSELMPIICSLAKNFSGHLACSALEIISLIALCDTSYTKMLYDTQIIEELWNFLSSSSGHLISDVRTAASDAFLSILRTDSRNCDTVIERGYIRKFVDALTFGQYRSRRESVIALHTLLTHGSQETYAYIANWQDSSVNSILEPLCDMLTVMDVETVMCALECIDHLLALQVSQQKCGTSQNKSYKVIMEEVGGIDKLDFLLNSQNIDIYVLATSILDNYFEQNEEDKDINEQPNNVLLPISSNAAFNF